MSVEQILVWRCPVHGLMQAVGDARDAETKPHCLILDEWGEFCDERCEGPIMVQVVNSEGLEKRAALEAEARQLEEFLDFASTDAEWGDRVSIATDRLYAIKEMLAEVVSSDGREAS